MSRALTPMKVVFDCMVFLQATANEESSAANALDLLDTGEIKLYVSEPILEEVRPFLRSSRNPLIRDYLEPSKFGNFRVEYGDLIWDDYGLCFPTNDLYENRI